MDKVSLVNYDKRIWLNSKLDGYQTDAYKCCYCTNCGAEFVGYVQRKYENEYEAKYHSKAWAIDEVEPPFGDKCPICGNSFQINPNDYESASQGDIVSIVATYCFRSYSTYEHRYGGYFEDKLEYRKKEISRKSAKRILQLEQSGSYNVTASITNGSTIKANPEKLKEYISHIVQLEGNIYAVKQRLTELYFQQSENEKYIIFCENKPLAEIAYLESQLDILAKDIIKAKEKQVQLERHGQVKYPAKPSKPQLLPVGAFDFIKGNAEKNKRMMAEYEQNMADYHNKVAHCDEEKVEYEKRKAEYASEISEAEAKIANNKAIIANKVAIAKSAAGSHTSPALVIKAMLDKEVQQAEELLRNLASTRAQLYSLDIVFGKYRDMVALSTFYEYLMAGRCTSLEGANGAYNLYESESRADLIITKLDDIVTRLDKIIDNQYTIASMMSNINNQLDRLNDTMGKAEKSLAQISQNTTRIAENSEVIAHNTAVNAYYSKVNAELTNSMGYLMAYKL